MWRYCLPTSKGLCQWECALCSTWSPDSLQLEGSLRSECDLGDLHAASQSAFQCRHDLLTAWILLFQAGRRGNGKGTFVHNSNFLFLLFNEEHLSTGNVCFAQKPATAPPYRPTPDSSSCYWLGTAFCCRGDSVMHQCGILTLAAPQPPILAPRAPPTHHLHPSLPPVSLCLIPSNYAAHESFFNVWFNTYRFFKQ